ncbi:MAG: alanyl-tRNA editing protein [Lactobacillus sp.]|jgi:Ser-tRNA(Ala) deacylase AlaX|nr:alanyl-tRNA editing protein [Lactobacillus sp.]
MTEAVYLTDANQKQLTTTVVQAQDNQVIFAESIIYPGGGGQPLDKAEIRQGDQTFQVLAAQQQGNDIVYTLDNPLNPQEPVLQVIDWPQRYQNMRYHTLLHLIASTAAKLVPCRVASNQIMADHARIELQFPSPAAKAGFDITQLANAIQTEIAAGHAVSWRSVARDKIADETKEVRTLVSLIPATVTQVRLVAIAGIDEEACAGTHVANTAEIPQTISFSVKNKGAKKVRIKVTF